MTLVQLTEVTHGEPTPLSVNPDHVATLRPRKTLVPLDAQQGDPRMTLSYNGTILALNTGEQHFVAEDYEAVRDLLTPPQVVFHPPPAVTPPAPTPTPTPDGGEVKKPAVSHKKKPEPAPEPVADAAEDMSALVPE